MENANLYSSSNGAQRKDSADFLSEYKSLFSMIRTMPNVIDVGSGDGFVTANILRKYLPEKIQGIYGFDKSDDMVNFANKAYKNSEIQFEQMDLNEQTKKELIGNFDLATALYCLHWMPDLELAFRNIYNFLGMNGLVLFCFPISHGVYDTYKILEKDPMWSDVMYDAFKYASPMEKLLDPASECRRIMKNAGFKNVCVDNCTKVYIYDGLKQFQDFFISINPFLKRINPEMVDRYISDFLNTIETMSSIDIVYSDNGNILSVATTYQLLIGYGFKL